MEDHCAGELITERFGEPEQMAGVRRSWNRSGLDLNAEDPAAAVLDDEIDLVSPATGANVRQGRLNRFDRCS